MKWVRLRNADPLVYALYSVTCLGLDPNESESFGKPDPNSFKVSKSGSQSKANSCGLTVEPWRLILEPWRLKVESWRFFLLVVADSHHFCEESETDPDPHHSTS
jgi:hypothetical protein